MFLYDQALAQATQAVPNDVPGVIQTLEAIDSACTDGDGLKWFNWLYLKVTRAVGAMVDRGGFRDPAWLAELDVRFASLYFSALHNYLSGADCPGAWSALFSVREDARVARIQFALAGVNAHINHDLPEAIVAACSARGIIPQHGSDQYIDYTAVNAPLENLIDEAKRGLHVRLLGDPLPAVSHLENTIAAWGTVAAREQAWNNAEALWHLRGLPDVSRGFLEGLDGLTTFGNKTLLAPVPFDLSDPAPLYTSV